MSLRAKLAALLLGVVAATAALSAWVTHALGSAVLAWSLVVAAALFPVLWLAGRIMRPIGQMLRALSRDFGMRSAKCSSNSPHG